MTRLAVVVIGRNEGDRLRCCLDAVRDYGATVVYVDSGSTDDSVAMSRAKGVIVIELDLSIAFTAARARNAGLDRVIELMPDVEYVQFVDGDCAINPDWLERGRSFLAENPGVAAVGGRVRERFPDRSVYNWLCDMSYEWPIGETSACGGIFMGRASALQQVHGFRPDLIAGEESEMCVRLRQAGWHIWCLPDEMVLHDAAMFHFWQWWNRTVRTGYAFALGFSIHGAPPERHCYRPTRSAAIWGMLIPLAAMLGAALISPWMVPAALVLYLLQMLRVYAQARGTPKGRAIHAVFLVVGKFAEGVGVIRFLWDQLNFRNARLIEYK